MVATSGQGQLEIRYLNEDAWSVVEPRSVICVSIGLESGTASVMGYGLAKGIMDNLIPGFSTVSRCDTESHGAETPQQASDYILKKGLERKLNTVVMPSVDFTPNMVAPMSMKRLQFAIGILTSVPEGKEPKVHIISGIGQSGERALGNVLRVKEMSGYSDTPISCPSVSGQSSTMIRGIPLIVWAFAVMVIVGGLILLWVSILLRSQ